MSTAICTLFEGDYHRGLGALVNSLCKHGYQGTVWAGYRGALPPWVEPRDHDDGDVEFRLPSGGAIRFVPVHTEVHLTNLEGIRTGRFHVLEMDRGLAQRVAREIRDAAFDARTRGLRRKRKAEQRQDECAAHAVTLDVILCFPGCP